MFSFIKNRSSGLRFKQGSFAFIKTTLVTKIMSTVFSSNRNMYVMTLLWKPYIHTVMTDESSFGLTVI